MKGKRSPRVLLVVIAAMFLLPLLLAWFMYTGAIDYKPGTTRNHGQLVTPPLPLSWDEIEGGEAFREHWVILHAVPDPCSSECISQVSALRQIHRASGRQQSRILIALLLDEPVAGDFSAMLKETYPQFQLVTDPSGDLQSSMQQAAAWSSAVYLVDPLGNIMMAYPGGDDPNHLKQDLKRLLTWSKLDEQ